MGEDGLKKEPVPNGDKAVAVNCWRNVYSTCQKCQEQQWLKMYLLLSYISAMLFVTFCYYLHYFKTCKFQKSLQNDPKFLISWQVPELSPQGCMLFGH